MASGYGFHYSHDDTRRVMVTTNANADTVEETDAEQEELRIGYVLGVVKRSIATVRAALTEQRGNVADMGRQVAAGIAKNNAQVVALEHRMAAHAADRAMLIKMSKQLDDITQQLAAEEAEATEPAPTEDPYAWVKPLRKDLLRVLKEAFIHAETAWDMYKPMVDHHATPVKLVRERLNLTDAEASAKLMTRIPSGKREGIKGRREGLRVIN
ncbi:hypothetical protein I4F81_010182 [Pyropia yezoensis]|uniref:Uncharacterized protein n=1 Tax=Pyropia yezoensis TaxID=2788 RepID=A0ACC3CBY1_PYRYE|nr:hypothetical protein I4F81_010182 [Neopyropia yezoensis]